MKKPIPNSQTTAKLTEKLLGITAEQTKQTLFSAAQYALGNLE